MTSGVRLSGPDDINMGYGVGAFLNRCKPVDWPMWRCLVARPTPAAKVSVSNLFDEYEGSITARVLCKGGNGATHRVDTWIHQALVAESSS